MTRTELKQRVQYAIEKFKEVMPPLDAPYPEIHITTAKTYQKTYEKLAKELGAPVSTADSASSDSESSAPEPILEAIWGKAGAAYLLRSELVEKYLNEDSAFDEITIVEAIWQTLGTYYAFVDSQANVDVFAGQEVLEKLEAKIDARAEWEENQRTARRGTARRGTKKRKNETSAASSSAAGPDNTITPEEMRAYNMQKGRDFWWRFASEAIENYVGSDGSKENETVDTADWDISDWGPVSDCLATNLHYIFSPIKDAADEPYHDNQTAFEYDRKINDLDVAAFFVNLLTNASIAPYVRAAEERRLVISDGAMFNTWDEKLAGDRSAKELDNTLVYADLTHFSELGSTLQIPLWKIKAVLEEQMKKERFWKADAVLIETLGVLLSELHTRIDEAIKHEWGEDIEEASEE